MNLMSNKTSIECPFCGVNYSTSDNNVSCTLIYTRNNGLGYYTQFDTDIDYHELNSPTLISNKISSHPDSIVIFMCVCPHCKKTYSYIRKIGQQYKNEHNYVPISPIIPISRISKYSQYVPKPIFQDYKESYSVLHLSPQSSATLSRRILEEIIENYFNINSGNLFSKIDELSNKSDLDDKTIRALQSFRKIGNIGAHMKVKSNQIVRIDNPGEAIILLKMIELLFDHTYVLKSNNKKTENKVLNLEKKYYKDN